MQLLTDPVAVCMFAEKSPNPLAYVYFGHALNADQLERVGLGELPVLLGNVAALSTEQAPDFLQFMRPNLTELANRYGETPSELGHTALRFEVIGDCVEAPEHVPGAIEQARQLITEIPAGYHAVFDVSETPRVRTSLRVQKTSSGDLLVGSQMQELRVRSKLGTPLPDPRVDYLCAAVFGSDGVPKDIFDTTPVLFDQAGQQVAEPQMYIWGKYDHPSTKFSYWTDYLSDLAKLVRADLASDKDAVAAALQKLQAGVFGERDATRTPLGDLSKPRFLQALTTEQQEDLQYNGVLPTDTIPSTLPSEWLLREMKFSGIATVVEALVQWGVPHVEVTYSAGVRELNARTLSTAVGLVLPTTEALEETRNQNDIYACILGWSADGQLIEREVLLYDGCTYKAPRDRDLDPVIPKLVVPQAVRQAMTHAMPQAETPHPVVTRLTSQRLTVDATSLASFSMLKPAGDGTGHIMCGAQELPLDESAYALLERLCQQGGRVVGELLVRYHRVGDELFPLAEDATAHPSPPEDPHYKRPPKPAA